MKAMAYKYAITEDMLSPILELLVANLDRLLPMFIGVFGLLLCIRVIPPLFAYLIRR